MYNPTAIAMTTPISPTMIWVNATNGSVTTATTGWNGSGTNMPATQSQAQQTMQAMALAQQPHTTVVEVVPQHIKLQLGKHRTITFPDGTVIDFYEDGRFKINDSNAKVTYKANRILEFNPFLNASDKLEAFIQYCGTVGVRQGDMLGIPIRHFIEWLVIEAARADGIESSQPLLLPDYHTPRCRTCGRFISRKLKAERIEFCRSACFEVQITKMQNRSEHDGYKSTSKASSKTRTEKSSKAGSETRAETGSSPDAAAAATATALRPGA